MDKKIAVVTGASKGIGFVVSKALYELGYIVILVARTEQALQQAATIIGKGHVDYVVADVTNPNSVKTLFKQVKNRYKKHDLLFNNAGISMAAKSIEEISYDEWKNMFDVNVHASFLCAKEAVNLMKHQTPMGGRIINNGSISAITPRLYSAAYTSSKHAITGLTKSISLDCRKYNIACGQINIGNAKTDLSSASLSGVYQADGSIQVEEMISVDNIAAAISMIVSLPLSTNVLEMTIMANTMPFIGRD